MFYRDQTFLDHTLHNNKVCPTPMPDWVLYFRFLPLSYTLPLLFSPPQEPPGRVFGVLNRGGFGCSFSFSCPFPLFSMFQRFTIPAKPQVSLRRFSLRSMPS